MYDDQDYETEDDDYAHYETDIAIEKEDVFTKMGSYFVKEDPFIQEINRSGNPELALAARRIPAYRTATYQPGGASRATQSPGTARKVGIAIVCVFAAIGALVVTLFVWKKMKAAKAKKSQ